MWLNRQLLTQSLGKVWKALSSKIEKVAKRSQQEDKSTATTKQRRDMALCLLALNSLSYTHMYTNVYAVYTCVLNATLWTYVYTKCHVVCICTLNDILYI